MYCIYSLDIYNYIVNNKKGELMFFHGSPKILMELVPFQARGIISSECQKGIYLTDTFLHAALYAVGKSLKGIAHFAVTSTELLIVGGFEVENGYVYFCNVVQENVSFIGNGQYISYEKIVPNKVVSVLKQDIQCFTRRFESLEEIKKYLKII
jgi:hypothetical protein